MAIFEAQLPIRPGYTEVIDINGNHVYMPTPAMERETQKDEEMDLFMSRTSATPVRLRLRIKATLIHTVGGESYCGCFRRALNKASLYGV